MNIPITKAKYRKTKTYVFCLIVTLATLLDVVIELGTLGYLRSTFRAEVLFGPLSEWGEA